MPSRILLLLFSTFAAFAAEAFQLGVLQAKPEQAEALRGAGLSQVVLSVSWDRFQPVPDAIGETYVKELRAQAAAFRRTGLALTLELGVQYPPRWLLDMADARYRNQFGDEFVDPSPGMNIANSVFNAAVRERQARYMESVFRELGTDWFAVRLGGGWYGELNYPSASFGGRKNLYWAFDDLAQGKREGLPAGMAACPVPGWRPGEASPEKARLFIEWYLESLRHYHDWQIDMARRHYDGPLMMLYPSWGIRPGQIDAAIATHLAGTSPAERNGEISRGFDFARFIGGIRDPRVWVQGTWIDSEPSWSDENSADPARWSPIHYLASLARAHDPPLKVSAENTGGGGMAALALSAERARAFKIDALYWAFAPDLFDGKAPVLEDLRAAFAPLFDLGP